VRQVLLRLLILSLLLGVPASGWAKEPARAFIDQRDIERMRAQEPQALTLLEAGERAYAGGDMKAAAELFTRAAELAPERGLLFRRKCQAFTALGRRVEAIAACNKGLIYTGSPMDLRASVAALLLGAAPTPEDLGSAALMAEKAVQDFRAEPWGYAARCDIAIKLSDRALLEDCLFELRRRAPSHYETRRAEAFLPPRQSALGVICFWLALLALAAFTLGHAVWRSWRGRRGSGAGLAILLTLCAAPGIGSAAEAVLIPGADSLGGPEQYPINDSDPVSSVPPAGSANRNPMGFGYFVMELSGRADQAAKDNKLPQAIQYFQALAKAVPESAVAYSKLCEIYEKLGNRAAALTNCDIALNREGVKLDDYSRLVRVALAKSGALEPELVKKLDAIVVHLNKTDSTRVPAALFQCEFAVRLEDVGRLTTCTQVLNKYAPNDPRAISFEWALAIKQADVQKADAAILRAQTANMPQAAVDAMEASTEQIRPIWARALHAWKRILGVLLVAIATGSLAWFMLRPKADGPAARSLR